MERISRYNIFVPVENNKYLVYNSVSGSYCLLKDNLVHEIQSGNLTGLRDRGEVYSRLKNEGIIVDLPYDEIEYVENLRFITRFNTNCYHLTVNPTLNCNLGCWYCYEANKTQAKMSSDTIALVIAHLKEKYTATRYRALSFNLFGGEPLLTPNVVKELLERVNSFCSQNDIVADYTVTTNGTLIRKDILECFNNRHVLFQITLDGNREKHDSVRHYKGERGKGSYNRILESLKLITQTLSNYEILVRINYDEKTLSYATEILDDLDFLPRKHVRISLHKVWQVSQEKIDNGQFFDFIKKANERLFIVDYFPFGGVRLNSCYADLYMQAVINHNGDVYKCTARDFNGDNKEGTLIFGGQILWDAEKVLRRLSTKAPNICRECSLYPSCIGICSQVLMEQSFNTCRYGSFEIEDLVVHNFNQHMVTRRIEKMEEQ